MPSVCFYFQVHQPYRIRRLSYFDHSPSISYFDDEKNRAIMQKVAAKCYLPANRLMLELINRWGGAFRISYSLSGIAVEQMERYAPEVLRSFQELAATGCVEFLGETYYHSLSAVYQPEEFAAQVKMHRDLMVELFAAEPRVFRNTELIYSDDIGRRVRELGFDAMLAEGADDVLGWRSPNFVQTLPGSDLRLLLKNYRLSDDIAFRFSNRGWSAWPLTAETYASWVHSNSGNGEVINLFMDYETLGEHQWECTGIFDFMRKLPEVILAHSDWSFKTPSEVIDSYPARGELPFHRLTSWADTDRDLTAWNGNRMQRSAISEIYSLRRQVFDLGDADLIAAWRKLQTSDHFYYMCTKWFADGDVHAYFSPFESPYDAFVHFMNVLRDFKRVVAELKRRDSLRLADMDAEAAAVPPTGLSWHARTAGLSFGPASLHTVLQAPSSRFDG